MNKYEFQVNSIKIGLTCICIYRSKFWCCKSVTVMSQNLFLYIELKFDDKNLCLWKFDMNLYILLSKCSHWIIHLISSMMLDHGITYDAFSYDFSYFLCIWRQIIIQLKEMSVVWRIFCIVFIQVVLI